MSNIFQRGASTARKHGLDAFTLGERAAILHHLDQAALIPNVVELENKKFPFEVRLGPALQKNLPPSLEACRTNRVHTYSFFSRIYSAHLSECSLKLRACCGVINACRTPRPMRSTAVSLEDILWWGA